jgi:hypothetical protein
MQPDTWIVTLGVLEKRGARITYYESRYNANEVKEVFSHIECAMLEAGRVVTRQADGVTTTYASATYLARTALGLRQ